MLWLWPGMALGAGELLFNGDFEIWPTTPTLPTGWTTDGAVNVAQETTNVRTGQYCVSLLRSGTSNQGIYETVTVTPGSSYEFAVWVKAPATLAVAIRLQYYNGSTALTPAYFRYNMIGGDWEKLTTGPCWAPLTATNARVSLRVYTPSGTNKSYWEDATLQEVSRSVLESTRGWSSEWDATAFNGGRRMVRDADGRFHVVFHSQASAATPGNPAGAPTNRPGGIYYSYTLREALDTPPPLSAADWVMPTAILGTDTDAVDDRYPSIAIAFDGSSPYLGNDRLHIVWQREEADGGQYDICYATKLNEPSGIGGNWDGLRNGPAFSFPSDYWLYTSLDRNSLVPTIDIGDANTVHVVWQEEDLELFGGNYYSEVLYKRSSSANWINPAVFDNSISMSPETNSQTPSIAIAHDDRYTTNYTYPAAGGSVIWVVFSDDYTGGIGSAPHIWLAKSYDDGVTWDTAGGLTGGLDVSVSAEAAGVGYDSYPNIAVQPWGTGGLPGPIEHIVWMHGAGACAADPDGLTRAGRGMYAPGVNPTVATSFPGPNPRMYGTIAATRDQIYYYSRSIFGVNTSYAISSASNRDNEFPTISIQGQGGPGLDDLGTRRLWVNWQEYLSTAPANYEIVQDSVTIALGLVAGLNNWFGYNSNLDESITRDTANDDLFPTLVTKKTAMYWPTGRSFPWTKIVGTGAAAAATANQKPIWFSASYEWEDPRPGDPESPWALLHDPGASEPTGYNMRDPYSPLVTDSAVSIFVKGNPVDTIYEPSISTLYYRKFNIALPTSPAWSAASFSYFTDDGSDEWFMATLNLASLSPVAGDIIEYYIEVNTDLKSRSTGDNESTMYLYGDNLETRMEVVAQGHPYRFPVLNPTPTPTPTWTEIPPTDTPTPEATSTPTDTPTPEPTSTPTPEPTSTPTDTPTQTPTDTPTFTPTDTPTFTPTDTPTFTPTDTPTFTPTDTPTPTPTDTPTMTPTPTPYPGENCSNPITINCGDCVTGSTIGYSNDHDCGSGHDGPDLVYSFTLPGDRWVTLIGETEFDSDWTLASSCQPDAVDSIFCVDRTGTQVDPSCGAVSQHSWGFINWSGLLPAGSYYLWIDSYYSAEVGGDYAIEIFCDENTPTPTPTATPTITPTFTPTPGPGDTCLDPIPLTCGSCVTGNTQWYNADHDCGSGHAGRDVVYSFTVETSGTEVLIVAEANYDADFTVATVCDAVTGDLSCVDTLAPQADPSCSSLTHNTYGFFNFTGTLDVGTYYVWIDSYNTTGFGDYALELTCVVPTATPTNTPEPTSTPTGTFTPAPPTFTPTVTPTVPTPTPLPVPATGTAGNVLMVVVVGVLLILGRMSIRK